MSRYTEYYIDVRGRTPTSTLRRGVFSRRNGLPLEKACRREDNGDAKTRHDKEDKHGPRDDGKRAPHSAEQTAGLGRFAIQCSTSAPQFIRVKQSAKQERGQFLQRQGEPCKHGLALPPPGVSQHALVADRSRPLEARMQVKQRGTCRHTCRILGQEHRRVKPGPAVRVVRGKKRR